MKKKTSTNTKLMSSMAITAGFAAIVVGASYLENPEICDEILEYIKSCLSPQSPGLRFTADVTVTTNGERTAMNGSNLIQLTCNYATTLYKKVMDAGETCPQEVHDLYAQIKQP